MTRPIDVFRETRQLVLEFFNGDAEKTETWFDTYNPTLGARPYSMQAVGQVGTLLEWVKTQLKENEPPPEIVAPVDDDIFFLGAVPAGSIFATVDHRPGEYISGMKLVPNAGVAPNFVLYANSADGGIRTLHESRRVRLCGVC